MKNEETFVGRWTALATALVSSFFILPSSFAQPLTLSDPVYLVDWYPASGGCVVTNCPIQFWDTLTNWWQHTCGSVVGDDFTGFYGGPNRYGTTNGMTWNFSTRSNNIGFSGEGFNLAPNYCRTLPTIVDVALTNIQAGAFLLVCSNPAAVSPSGFIHVWRNAPLFQWGDTDANDGWTNQAANLPGTNRYTQAELTSGALMGWTGGAGMTNLQVFANKHGATYMEIRAHGASQEERMTWDVDHWEVTFTGTNYLSVDYVGHVNEENYDSPVVAEYSETLPAASDPALPPAKAPCFASLASYDCATLSFAGSDLAPACYQWPQFLNGSVTGLEGRWRTWGTNSGDWIITNYTEVVNFHALTNTLSGGTGGWRTNLDTGTYIERVRTGWTLYMVIANSYLYFDLARFATNSLCQ